MYKVSVVVPIYNVEKYLRQGLISIINQTLKDIEIICVDDCSTDHSYEIAEEYAKKDNRIMLLRHEKNKYAGVARNTGLEVATGEYVMCLDPDDFFDPDMLETLYNLAKENEADIAVCSAYQYNDITREVSKYLDIGGKIRDKNGKVDVMKINAAPWDKMIKLQFIKENQLRFSSSKTGNDIYFGHLALTLAERAVFTDEFLVYYRINNQHSLQGNPVNNTCYDSIREFKKVYLELERRNRLNMFREGLVNKIYSSFSSRIYKTGCYEEYKRAYDYFKNEVLKGIGLLEEDNIRLFTEKQKKNLYQIAKLSAEEFIFYNASELKKQEIIAGIQPGAKIVLYGAGKRGKLYFNELLTNEKYKLVLWVDRDYENINIPCCKIEDPAKIIHTEYDKVLIAIADSGVVKQVKEYLVSIGVEEKRIVSNE